MLKLIFLSISLNFGGEIIAPSLWYWDMIGTLSSVEDNKGWFHKYGSVIYLNCLAGNYNPC